MKSHYAKFCMQKLLLALLLFFFFNDFVLFFYEIWNSVFRNATSLTCTARSLNAFVFSRVTQDAGTPIPNRHSMRADELQYQATGTIRIPAVRNSRTPLFLPPCKLLKPASSDMFKCLRRYILFHIKTWKDLYPYDNVSYRKIKWIQILINDRRSNRIINRVKDAVEN